MSDCCASSGCNANHPKKHPCPGNGQEYSEVSARTIAHHIKDAWSWHSAGHRYFFCDDPACEIVYFSENGSTILKSQLRTPVGLKEPSDSGLLMLLLRCHEGRLLGQSSNKGLCHCPDQSWIVFLRHQQPIRTLLSLGLPKAK